MLSTIISFFGGTLMRAVWGEISAWITKRQDHAYEIERMRVQDEIEARQHERQLDGIRVQAALQIKTIAVQSEADIAKVEVDGWLEAVKATAKSIGAPFIDGWNACIRPGVATWAVAMLTAAEFGAFVMSENAASICSAALGIYLAERNLLKRGK